MRKRISQALVLDELSGLYSYLYQSDKNKEYSNRHLNEFQLSQRLFEDWFGEESKFELDEILELFDKYDWEKDGTNALKSMLQLHKKHYSSMIRYPCKSCEVKEGTPCLSSKRKNIGDSPTEDGNNRFKRTLELRKAMEKFYQSHSKLRDLNVDFTPTKDLHLYKAPFSCK